MIDPKFNALPVTAEGDFENVAEESLSEAEGTERLRKPRQGLSINDTVAANANLSVGSRGVDTSGSSVGAGAGAGMTFTTPGDDDSPAPNIVPGARGSGTTARGDAVSGQTPTTRLNAGTEGAETLAFSADEISVRAYRCWHERGCPHGSPEVDWERATQQLREQKERERTSAASA
jgi:hypothetical protein